MFNINSILVALASPYEDYATPYGTVYFNEAGRVLDSDTGAEVPEVHMILGDASIVDDRYSDLAHYLIC